MDALDQVVDTYNYLESELETNNPIATALLTFCVVAKSLIKDFTDNLDRFICLGIRHGLFGIDALERTSINDIASRLEEIPEALHIGLRNSQILIFVHFWAFLAPFFKSGTS
jgi:hypothetical protein